MSEASADAASDDAEEHDSGIPEPPRRVPFGVVVTTVLLGMLSLPLIMAAVVLVFSGESFTVGVGEAALRGLGASVVAVCAVLVVAVGWSFVRDGNTVGPMAVGVVAVLTGLILLVVGVAGEAPETAWLRVGVLALVLGLGVLLVPLLGHGPAYLAARRVWSRAERDWLHDLTTPAAPPMGHPQQWPGQYPPQQQWGGAPQHQQPPPGYPPAAPGYPPQPGYPAQYQYPPQQAPAWAGQHPQQHQAWPEAAIPPWPAQQAPAQQAPVQQAPAQQAPAQQAPTEQIRATDPTPSPDTPTQ